MIPTLLQIAAGGALGATGRHLLEQAVPRLPQPGMPLGILTVNVIGCLAMGLFVGLAPRLGLSPLSPFLVTGFLGGFTTFSTFTREAMVLMQNDQPATALFYVFVTLAISFAALYLGLFLTRAFT